MEVIDDIKIANKLLALRNSAKSRGIEFGLSFNRVKRVLNTKRCYFTGVKLNHNADDKNQLTFDRVDNDRGYVDNNVVACSKWFNQMKSNLTVEEIKLLYKGIMKHSK
jgi:hypothetical protein